MVIEIVRASGGGDSILWVILGVIWLIAQAIAKIRGGGKEPKPPPIFTGEKSIEDDLKTLFEQLSGQGAPRPPPPPASPPSPITNPMKPIPHGAPKPSPKPSQPKHKTATRVEMARITTKPAIVIAPTTSEVSGIPPLSISRSRGGLFKESTFSFNAIKTPLPAAKPLGVNLLGTGAHLRQLVKGRKPLKQAMISRIVLGPPKAFSI
jgi:hypothetical protein